ncbi:flagellar alpha dynein [Microcoleus sp. N3A4]|uniref:flagellar alpha dynein n=1 Tax=Microcoleus sp. N3A4 TaxID=3055379 RepID=UPI002FD18729
MLTSNYDELEDRYESAKAELVKLRSQLATERADREEIKNSAPIAIGVEFPEPAVILSQLRTKRKKSKADLADIEVILELLES